MDAHDMRPKPKWIIAFAAAIFSTHNAYYYTIQKNINISVQKHDSHTNMMVSNLASF